MTTEKFPRPPEDELPRLKERQASNNRDFTLTSLINAEGNLDLGVAYAAFFWPEFVEIEGCILLKDHYDPDNFISWMHTLNGDRKRVESVINHTHFYDVHLNDSRQEEQSLASYEYMAQIAMRTWRAALAEQFPDRQFEFLYVTEPDDYGPTLYLWQV